MSSKKVFVVIESGYNYCDDDLKSLGVFEDQEEAYYTMIAKVLTYFANPQNPCHEAFSQYLDDYPENEEWICNQIPTQDKAKIEALPARDEYDHHPLLKWTKENYPEIYDKYWLFFLEKLMEGKEFTKKEQLYHELDKFRWEIVEGHDLETQKYLHLITA